MALVAGSAHGSPKLLVYREESLGIFYAQAACKRFIEVSMGLVRALAGTLTGQGLEPQRPTVDSCNYQ